MALTPEQLEEVRKELAARMGSDSTFKNPRTEGAGFMGFGTKTDPLLGESTPSDNLLKDAAGNEVQKTEVQDAGAAAQQGYQNASGRQNNDALSNALKNFDMSSLSSGFGSAAGSKLPTGTASALPGGDSFGASGVPADTGNTFASQFGGAAPAGVAERVAW